MTYSLSVTTTSWPAWRNWEAKRFSTVGHHLLRLPISTRECGFKTDFKVSKGSRHKKMETRVSTRQRPAITRSRRSLKSGITGGLLSGSGYGTICGTSSVMRPPRLLARFAASFKAASVASTEVNTTEILSFESVSSATGRAGTPVAGAIILSSASAMRSASPLLRVGAEA